MAAVEVRGEDVIRLLLQFFDENNLDKTMQVLQEESQVYLNTVPSMEKFLQDVRQGNWDAVLQVAKHISIPANKLMLLYDQITLELIELRELDVAKSILRDTEPMQLLKNHDSLRYMKLEGLLLKTFFDHRDAYPDGLSREKRRQVVATALSNELQVVPPARLVSILTNAIRWQQYTGVLPPGTKYDLFRGHTVVRQELVEGYPTTPWKRIQFPDSYPTVSVFSPNGFFFATGSTDGLIEVWDSATCTTAQSLKYQSKENFMAHTTGITALVFSRDSEMIASGDDEGCLKVWKVETGQCLRKIDKAQGKAILSVSFSRNSENVLTCGVDGNARVHSIKSGNLLRKYSHKYGRVLSACFSPDITMVVTSGDDETVRFWDTKTMDEVAKFELPLTPTRDPNEPCPIHTVFYLPNSNNLYVICPTASNLYVVNGRGQVQFTVKSGNDDKGGEFTRCTSSPKGGWLHCVGMDQRLYSFEMSPGGGGSLENVMTIGQEGTEIVSIAHHPHQNLLITASDDGRLNTWKRRKQDDENAEE